MQLGGVVMHLSRLYVVATERMSRNGPTSTEDVSGRKPVVGPKAKYRICKPRHKVRE